MKYLRYFEDNIWRDREKKTKELYKNSMSVMTLNDTIDYVINHCQDFINNPFRVSRSIITDNTVKYFQSEPVKRFSRDDKNFYNLIIDNSDKWKKYPKRSKSFMCSLNETSLTGTEYLVIPEDNSHWAISPKFDIYDVFTDTIEKYTYERLSLEKFFYQLDTTAEKYGIELSDTNYKELRNNIKLLEAAIKYEGNEKVYYSLKYFFENNDNIWQCILNILDPKLNGMQLLNWSEINPEKILSESKNSGNLEMWTDSPCVFVNYDVMNKFLGILEEKTDKKIIQDIL